jgi:hypothetical protein
MTITEFSILFLNSSRQVPGYYIMLHEQHSIANSLIQVHYFRFFLVIQVSFMHGAWALQANLAQAKKRMYTHLRLLKANSWSHTMCCMFLVGGNTLSY